MKRIVVILTLAFITCFAGTSQAHGWGRWGWRHHCWGGPRPCIIVPACYHPAWFPGYWIWNGPYRVWVRGCWR